MSAPTRPPKECYDPKLNADGRCGRPLLRLGDVVCTAILSLFASLRVDCARDHWGWVCFRQLRTTEILRFAQDDSFAQDDRRTRPATSLLAESTAFPRINLHPAGLEDFRRILLQNYAPKYRARGLKIGAWYMVE
jgi:hypothetical protein